jgi:hypothetical protein
MKYKLTVKPAIPGLVSHKIQEILENNGYDVHGGGTYTDLSECDITFSDEKEVSSK